MSRLLDPKKKGEKDFPFEYRGSANTDVRLTWQKAREQHTAAERELSEKLRQITKKTNGR